MKKKILLILIAITIAFSLFCVSCKNPNPSEHGSEPNNGETENPSNELENPNESGNSNESDNPGSSPNNEKDTVEINYAHIEIDSEILNLRTFSNGVEQENGFFQNGGKVTVNDKGVYLDRISQKDKVTFDWVLVNKSNIDIKYKPYLSLPYGNDLTDNLTISLNGSDLDSFMKRQWRFAALDTQNTGVETVKVEIELPELEDEVNLSNSTGQIEIFSKVNQGNLDIYNDVKVTPENIATVDFSLDETQYEFYGHFSNPIVKAFDNGNLRQIYDGTNAIIDGQLKIYLQREISDVNSIISSDKAKERYGEYSLRNFKFITDSISVIACSTKITIENNNCGAIDIAAPNCEVDVINNTINSLTQKHKRFDGGLSSYGFYFYHAINYICRFDSNTVSNTLGHAVVFHGTFGVLNNYNWNTVDQYGLVNKIHSFQKNEIVAASGKSCIKFWDDHQYSANQAYNDDNHVWNNGTLDKPEEDLIIFVKNQYNVFNLANTNSYIFSFYDVMANDIGSFIE